MPRGNPAKSLLRSHKSSALRERPQINVWFHREENEGEHRHQLEKIGTRLRRHHPSNAITKTPIKHSSNSLFVQVHDVEFAPSLDIVLNETIPAVREAKDQGKARFIGVTGYPVSVLADCIQKSKIPVDMVLCYTRLSLLDQTLSQYMPVFKVSQFQSLRARHFNLVLVEEFGHRQRRSALHGATEQRGAPRVAPRLPSDQRRVRRS